MKQLEPIALVVGTRPEVIKMAPVHRALLASESLSPVLISTGQHRELLASALQAQMLSADFDLGVMTRGQTPNQVAARVLERLPEVLEQSEPRAVLVQGDTTTALAAALAAFHLELPVGHVEAGLRTRDLRNPFPEEANRQMIDRMARWCFAPTARSARALREEGIEDSRVQVTGNTGIDALLWTLEGVEAGEPVDVLVTLHRRESFGAPLREILRGLRDFLEENPGLTALWPAHPNPEVRAALFEDGADLASLRICEPMDYHRFCRALAASRLVLTDSGGIQEEAPSLGKLVVVARETTERPEGIDAGVAVLAGTTRAGILDALRKQWRRPRPSGPIPFPSPYGDGHAAERIVEQLERDLAAARTGEVAMGIREA